MEITFLLNGETARVEVSDPTVTLLDWLREERGLTGTKEGCNEGDCGACTVMITDDSGAKALNACILFMPQLAGKAVRTVEGISGPDGEMHPVQDAMIAHHGSQCGFCTPGFVVSMAVAHKNGATDFDDQLAGNLCRCTGYAPIIRAAEAALDRPVPAWMHDEVVEADAPFAPASSDELADWYDAHPDGTLIAGATGVGLWVTKQFRELGDVAFLHNCKDLQQIEVTDDLIRIGAAVTMTDVGAIMGKHHPSFAELIRRAEAGEAIELTRYGRPVAQITPVPRPAGMPLVGALAGAFEVPDMTRADAQIEALFAASASE